MLFRITPQDQMIVNINIQLILHRMSFIGFRNALLSYENTKLYKSYNSDIYEITSHSFVLT